MKSETKKQMNWTLGVITVFLLVAEPVALSDSRTLPIPAPPAPEISEAEIKALNAVLSYNAAQLQKTPGDSKYLLLKYHSANVLSTDNRYQKYFNASFNVHGIEHRILCEFDLDETYLVIKSCNAFEESNLPPNLKSFLEGKYSLGAAIDYVGPQ